MSAAKLGIRFATRRMVRSINAHRLTEWCNQLYPSRSDELVQNIFYQYFEVGVDISSIDNLVEIAVISGLNRFEVQRVLNSKVYLDEVTEKDSFAKLRLRVSGVPSFTINYQTKRKPFTFSGAQVRQKTNSESSFIYSFIMYVESISCICVFFSHQK